MPTGPISFVAKFAAAALLGSVATLAMGADSKPTKIRYQEVVRSVLYAPMYAAHARGFFSDEGLDVDIITAQGTDKGMAALISGAADVVLIGPEATVYVAGSESPVKPKVFAGLTATDGFLLVSREPVDEFNWDMVKGKSLMTFRKGSNPDVFLEHSLRKHGIDPKKDVNLVSNVGAAARAGAWVSGQNDFAIFLEPEAGNMERGGHGQVVASIGDEVGQVDFTSFTATDEYIENNPEIIKTWTRVIDKALKYVQDAKPEQLAADLQPYFTGLNEDELVFTINRYRKHNLWKADPVVKPEAIEQLQDMLIASEMLDASERVAYEDVVFMDYAKEVASND